MRCLAISVAMAVASGAPSSAQVPATVARAPRRRSLFARQSLNTDPPGDIFTAHRVRDTITQALDDSTQPLDAAELVQRLIEIATLNAAAADKHSSRQH